MNGENKTFLNNIELKQYLSTISALPEALEEQLQHEEVNHIEENVRTK